MTDKCLINKYLKVLNIPVSEKKEAICIDKFQELLKIRLSKAICTEDLENVIDKTYSQFRDAYNDEAYLGDLFEHVHNSNEALDSKREYVAENFPKYFLTK
jgi:hypothetical protein